MTPREIIYANLDHHQPERPGLTFSGNRINDMTGCGIGGSEKYESKRWIQGNFEYYDDEWGNIWFRVADLGRVGRFMNRP
jgi:hypothetical protein